MYIQQGHLSVENTVGIQKTSPVNKADTDTIGARFRTRRHNLIKACENQNVYQVRPTLKSIKDRNLLYDVKHNYVYCMVEKVGCTFWRRIFHLLKHPEISDIYSIGHHAVHNERLPTLRDYDVTKSTAVIQSAKTAMFVREPYARAFSGYVDKLFSMNHYYMPQLGIPIIKSLRANATADSLACGHDTTFSELLTHLVRMKQRNLQNSVDIHFSQIYTHCLPCEVKYDFIGTMETFNEDASYLIKHIGLFDNKSLDLTHTDSVRDSILLVLRDTFDLKNKMARCMTWDDMYRRAWKTLQLRGLIRPDAPVPTLVNVTVDALYHEAVKVTDPSRMTEYKRQALIDMYRGVDRKLLEQFREYVLPDCRLFGYNDRPAYIFSVE